MDAGVEEQEPDDAADEQVEYFALDAEYRTEQEYTEECGGVDKKHHIDVAGVEGCYDYDAAYVIHYCEGGKEYFKRKGHSLAKHGEYAKRECNVGGHGDGCSAGVVGAAAEVVEYEYRHNHATDSADNGQKCLFERR